MNNDNPYESPDSSDPKPSDRSSKAPIVACTIVGVICGVLWTVIFGPLTDGPPSIILSAFVYVSGFALTGFVVGLDKGHPFLVGPLSGVLILSAFAIVVGPKDGWITIWIIIFGGSGLVWGVVIGGLGMVILRRYATSSP